MSQARIYLDHAATTPVSAVARAAMAEALERWHNPSSPHAEGRAAKAALEGARERIRAALGWTGKLIFTSGASEAAALAFARSGRGGRRPIVSAVEHDCVLRQVPAAERVTVGVGSDGLVDRAELAALLRSAQGQLVAIQHVNSETGVIQPIADIQAEVAAAGSHLFVDCAQSAGKLPLPPADMIALSAHKFGGPPGIGALLVSDLSLLEPQGGQEQGYRGGTENLPAILGFAAAIEAHATGGDMPDWLRRQADNRALLEGLIGEQGGQPICPEAPRSPFVGSYRMPGVSATAQLVQFDMAGFAVSAGSACSSGSLKPSHVLAAIGCAPEQAGEVIRVSFGFETKESEVRLFAEQWARIADRRRAA